PENIRRLRGDVIELNALGLDRPVAQGQRAVVRAARKCQTQLAHRFIPRTKSPELPETEIIASGERGVLPPPLAGEGWGGVSRKALSCCAPSLSLPRKRGRGRCGTARANALLTQSAPLRAGFGSARCAAKKSARAWDLPRSGAAPRDSAGAPRGPFPPAAACCGLSAPACARARRGGAGARSGRAPLRPLPGAKSW